MSDIKNFLFFVLFIALLTSSLFLKENFSTFCPLSCETFDIKILAFLSLKLIFNVQNSIGLKSSISCSLSVINFKATD